MIRVYSLLYTQNLDDSSQHGTLQQVISSGLREQILGQQSKYQYLSSKYASWVRYPFKLDEKDSQHHHDSLHNIANMNQNCVRSTNLCSVTEGARVRRSLEQYLQQPEIQTSDVRMQRFIFLQNRNKTKLIFGNPVSLWMPRPAHPGRELISTDPVQAGNTLWIQTSAITLKI